MTIWLRNVIYLLIVLGLSPWLWVRSLRTGRYRRGLREKFLGLKSLQTVPAAADPATTIWLHGVSVGEIRLLQPLVEHLRGSQPQTRVVVSTTTDAGMLLASKIMPAEVGLFYFPLDFSWAVRRTMRAVNPSLLVLGELELWPNLIAIAAQEQIPVAVINGRLSRRSFQGYRRFAYFTRPMFSALRWVGAQSAEYAERFRQCGTPSAHVAVTGSIKFDNVNFDRCGPAVTRLSRLVGVAHSTRVFVAGSTQIEEERAALAAHLALRDTCPSLRTIIVPRHPERFDQVAHMLRGANVRYLRRSQLIEPVAVSDWEVLLVDTVGELTHWWGLAEIALVGGSFGHRGGQNMLEPAAYGANVAFGPNTSNFRDISHMLLSGQAAVRLDSVDQMRAWLQQQLSDPLPGKQRGARARQIIAAQQGALARTAEQLICMHVAANPGLTRAA